MAILAALLAFGSRFASKVLTTALGWATTLLFGRVPASRQILLLGVAFGSVIWMVLVAGVVSPDVGAFLLVLLPRQEFVPQEVIRLIMLAGALIVPGIIGALTYRLGDRDGSSIRELAGATVRGYPLTVLLAVLLVFLALLSIWRKGVEPRPALDRCARPLGGGARRVRGGRGGPPPGRPGGRPRGHAGRRSRDDVSTRALACAGGWSRVAARSSPSGCCNSKAPASTS